MFTAPFHRLRDYIHLLRLVVVLVALACQIGGSAALSGAADRDAALLAAASTLCQSGQHKHGQDAPSPHRHMVDQAIVNLAAADSQCAALLDSAPTLPGPVSGRIGCAANLPGARAPPARYVSASFPRGPPPPV